MKLVKNLFFDSVCLCPTTTIIFESMQSHTQYLGYSTAKNPKNI